MLLSRSTITVIPHTSATVKQHHNCNPAHLFYCFLNFYTHFPSFVFFLFSILLSLFFHLFPLPEFTVHFQSLFCLSCSLYYPNIVPFPVLSLCSRLPSFCSPLTTTCQLIPSSELLIFNFHTSSFLWDFSKIRRATMNYIMCVRTMCVCVSVNMWECGCVCVWVSVGVSAIVIVCKCGVCECECVCDCVCASVSVCVSVEYIYEQKFWVMSSEVCHLRCVIPVVCERLIVR